MNPMMRISAPELSGELEWFNTPSPLSMKDVRGRIVILDFWTYCCINCMHVLPDLRYLEEKYPDCLVVIGLHSPKFPNEKVGEHVQKAINRYDIRHPVAHDPEFRMWREYGVRAWPSLAVIDPECYVAAMLSGEGNRQQLDRLIQQLVEEGERAGTLRRAILPAALQPEPETTLRFPGKVHCFDSRLAISDSGHHRVLITDFSGKITKIYGDGEPALIDGRGSQARFRDPQGLVAVGTTLYVADTGNHALRAIDLTTDTVRTIAGTGEQGRSPDKYFENPLRTSLNSPWDIAFYNGQLLIAMAGPHQIWYLDLALDTLGVFAGSGREDILDGESHTAAFAQPSGLAVDRGQLYVADSETSAIRRIDLHNQTVTTLVGMGLFEFGDRDGVGRDARLQHPLGVATDPKRHCLWIADTYNHKIKKLDINSKSIYSFLAPKNVTEPGGLAVCGDILWVANTNAHQLLRIDLAKTTSEPVEIHA